MTVSSSEKLMIVDYRTGNLNSIKRALARIGISSFISSSPAEIASAEKIILPGVGHFATAMSRLRELGLIDVLNRSVLNDKKPVLGICLGMELMAAHSNEGDVDGLGWINAKAVRFRLNELGRCKVPHMGWNQISIKKSSRLMDGIQDGSEFYFAHSYHLSVADRSAILNETDYESIFTSAIESGNIFGVQYHPEKSHDLGLRLLKNFAHM